jgi:hypothetical protein
MSLDTDALAEFGDSFLTIFRLSHPL